MIRDGKILLIHRHKAGREYYVLPGGGVEDGESVEAATLREIKEETSLDATLGRKLWVEEGEYDHRVHHVFLVTDFSGEMQLGGQEAKQQSPANTYTLEWHALDALQDLPIYSEVVKQELCTLCEKEEGLC